MILPNPSPYLPRYLNRAALDGIIPAHSLVQLSNDNPAATSPDERVIEALTLLVEELMDGYLRGRYALPFSPVPTILQGIAQNLVRYELYSRRPEGAMPEGVKEAHHNAIRLLETIRDGRVSLGLETGASTPAPSRVLVSARPQHFGRRDFNRPSWRQDA